MGEGRGLDAVLGNMFQLKISMKLPLEVSRRRDVREFLEIRYYLSKEKSFKNAWPKLLCFVCLFCK